MRLKDGILNDLTFYFKNDTLQIIFNNDVYGLANQTLDIPLPKLQDYLKLELPKKNAYSLSK